MANMNIAKVIGLLVLGAATASAQPYTSYITGDPADVTTASVSGTVLMGGATENDNAVRWFLNRADGGDVVVLRTTGDDGYNDYFYSDLGVTVNSVETIVCTDPASGADAYVIQQVQNAEALWFAGGDQWDYISYWRDTPLEDAINNLINVKHIPIGGTSAGCAIQGQAYFSAENGTITSSQALNDPFHALMTLGNDDFLQNPATSGIITDTHYDNPDRKGRHMTFLARLYTDTGIEFRGIGVEEYTAVCIDENNIAYIFGSYPDYDDFAFFLQPNCVMPNTPEACVDGDKLTWDRNDAALKVIKIAGTDDGAGFVDLNDWKTVGGAFYQWENWSVDNAAFTALEEALPIDCTVDIADINSSGITLFPNPAVDYLRVRCPQAATFEIRDITGRLCMSGNLTAPETQLNTERLVPGTYAIVLNINGTPVFRSFIVQ